MWACGATRELWTSIDITAAAASTSLRQCVPRWPLSVSILIVLQPCTVEPLASPCEHGIRGLARA